ncbi:MAG: energy transducer TonB [Nitrospirae bacterium]|nr:energy transducer TonB [Nitrospirota bacterium]
MKKYIAYSLLLHLLLVLIAFLLVRYTKLKTPETFVASIVAPEELQEKKQPEATPHMQEKDLRRMPRLPKNLPPPEKLTALPSSPAQAKKSRSVERPEENVSANAGRGPSVSPHEPSPTRDEPGMSQEQGKRGIGDSFQSSRQPSWGRTTRDKLLDREVIDKFASKDSETKKDNSITFDTTEYKYYGYMQRLREKIEGIWKYPAEAEQRKLNGEVYIRFTIRKDGALAAAELVHTSGYKVLDDAAIRALKEANPYWPLPDSWNQDSLTITGRFVYYFYNTYIR